MTRGLKCVLFQPVKKVELKIGFKCDPFHIQRVCVRAATARRTRRDTAETTRRGGRSSDPIFSPVYCAGAAPWGWEWRSRWKLAGVVVLSFLVHPFHSCIRDCLFIHRVPGGTCIRDCLFIHRVPGGTRLRSVVHSLHSCCIRARESRAYVRHIPTCDLRGHVRWFGCAGVRKCNTETRGSIVRANERTNERTNKRTFPGDRGAAETVRGVTRARESPARRGYIARHPVGRRVQVESLFDPTSLKGVRFQIVKGVN